MEEEEEGAEGRRGGDKAAKRFRWNGKNARRGVLVGKAPKKSGLEDDVSPH
jgi:hypothetical protein